ncbi:MAG: siderophore-interacting protein [Ilumatobacteraceae bacterium]
MIGRMEHPIVLRRLTVRRVADLTDRMRRITLGGDELDGFSRHGIDHPPFRTAAPDDHVRLFFPAGTAVLPIQLAGRLDWSPDGIVHRDYTVRRFDATTGELDIDVVRHPGGIAACWAEHVEVGSAVDVAGPPSSHLPPSADHQLLVGDESALPAIARWLEESPPGATFRVIVAIGAAGAVQPIAVPAGVSADITWCVAGAGDVVDVVRALPPLPGDVRAFVAGERSMVGAVRRHLRDERGLPAAQVRAVGYWRRGITDAEAERLDEELAALSDLFTPYAIRVAVDLGLVDAIAAGATTTDALASVCGADPISLAALVAALAAKDVLGVSPAGAVTIGRLGDLLRADHPGDWPQRLRTDGIDGHFDLAWAGLATTVRTGRPGYETVVGEPFWQHLAIDDRLAASFDEMLEEWSDEWAPHVAAGHDWTAYGHIMDVGGGTGRLLVELLRVAPDAVGTVVDLPATTARATAVLAAAGHAERAVAIAADFFGPLPHADAVVLAQVLHDWPDDDAVRILLRCREALDGSAEGRVLVIERGAAGPAAHGIEHADEHDDGDHHGMTLLMRNLFGARERSGDELAELADRAGLRVVADEPIGHGLRLLELGER